MCERPTLVSDGCLGEDRCRVDFNFSQMVAEAVKIMVKVISLKGVDSRGCDRAGRKDQLRRAPLVMAPRQSIAPGSKIGICISLVLERGVRNLGERIQAIKSRIE